MLRQITILSRCVIGTAASALALAVIFAVSSANVAKAGESGDLLGGQS